MGNIEILAPAGSFECMKAAVAAGADAVYVGGDRFGARAYAHNFDQEELIRAIHYIHLYGKKLYLTVNILLKEQEIEECVSWLKPFYESGLDAVIVQDIGVARLLHKSFPDLPVHASTQMSITSVAGVRLLKENGVKRVIPARELSLDEIRCLTRQGGLEIEAFVHGAMCYAYSGKCLFSSFLGDRSGNRGRCAQPCRLPYRAPGDQQNRYWLSMQDLSMISRIPDLIEAGVCSFKIEGRMKSPDYVYTVTSLYRKYTDLYLNSSAGDTSAYEIDPHDQKLLKSYSRNLTGTGYYDHRNGPTMITKDNPSFKSGEKESIQNETYEPEPLRITASISVIIEEPAVLTLSCQDASVQVESDQPVQRARKAPLTESDVCTRLAKTDQYPFEITWKDNAVDGQAFLPVSVLNDMRRSALERLQDALLAGYARKVPHRSAQSLSDEHAKPCERSSSRSIHALVSNPAQFNAVLQVPTVTEVIVESGCLTHIADLEFMIEQTHQAYHPKKLIVALPHIARFDGDPELLPDIYHEDWIEALRKTDGVVVRNLDQLNFLKESGFDKPLYADFMLYAFNYESAWFMHENGAAGFCYPLEMHRKDIFATEKKICDSELAASLCREVFIYGFAPRMISAQCIQKNTDKCRHKSGTVVMTDRRGEQFTVQNRCDSCYNIVYNSVPVSLHNRLDSLKNHPYLAWRFDFTREKPEEINAIIDLFTGEAEECSYRYTKGHWDKGVL